MLRIPLIDVHACALVQRDLRKDFRSDGHTEADFEAEVISLVNMEKSRHWGGGWIAASEGMDCRS